MKYHDGLEGLPRYYRALTEGSGAQDGTGPEFSDGLLFSQLSRPIFEFYEGERNEDGSNHYSYDEIQELVTEELTSYLKGEHQLLHPGTGQLMAINRAMNPLELAVCLQNKRYERRAAEAERAVLTRGTPEGVRGNPDADPLLTMSRSERLKYIATLDEPLYFEARNLSRHRAHEDALGRYARDILEIKTEELSSASFSESESLKIEIELLEKVMSFYHMNDLYTGEEINLYQEVGVILDYYNQIGELYER